MTISKIAEDLNQALTDSVLSDFQAKRAARLGHSRLGSRQFFSKRTIHKGYAYHHGGRCEIQFNIGFEKAKFFRYGIALSLQKDQSLPDPVSSMAGRIRKLSEIIRDKPELFDGLQMWRSYAGNTSKIRKVTEIPESWITQGSFIFIGRRKKVGGLQYRPTSTGIRTIVKLIERLHSVYEAVEEGELSTDRYRAARIVWNDEGWRHPSGPVGKVKTEKNFERAYGFGLEEWIFDASRLVGDYHYSYLRCFGYHHAKYRNKTFDVLLYARHAETKERFWVGRVMNMSCLDTGEAKKILKRYKKEGWLTQMAKEVDQVGGQSAQLTTAEPLSIINCKFRLSDLEIFDEPRPSLLNDDEHIKALYYDTFTKLPSQRFFRPQPPQFKKDAKSIPADLSKYGADGIKVRYSRKSLSKSEKTAELRHKDWQKKLLVSLREQYGESKVGVEVPAGTGFADAVIHVQGLTVIIELKTGSSTKQLVREALGQVMEYGFWPGMLHTTFRLVVAGEPRLDGDTASYLEFIRQTFRIPVWYLRYRRGSLPGLDDVLDWQE